MTKLKYTFKSDTFCPKKPKADSLAKGRQGFPKSKCVARGDWLKVTAKTVKG